MTMRYINPRFIIIIIIIERTQSLYSNYYSQNHPKRILDICAFLHLGISV